MVRDDLIILPPTFTKNGREHRLPSEISPEISLQARIPEVVSFPGRGIAEPMDRFGIR
jgi:hypothetical protein